MPYLLDTNALSEIDKPRPDQEFMKWFRQADAAELYISCLTVGELYKGLELQPQTAKREKLERHTSLILQAFGDRILAVDQATAQLWGQLMAGTAQKSQTAPTIDALIAAQCLQQQLAIVTRNVRDFSRFPGLQVISPWTRGEA